MCLEFRGALGVAMALGATATFAADWYTKDNLQPGHDILY